MIRTSKLWLLGPPFALALTAVVYYVKFQDFRTWTNRNIPWVRENVAPKLPGLTDSGPPAPLPKPKTAPTVSGTNSPEPGPNTALPAPATPPPPQKSYVLKDGSVDLQELAASPADWPKAIRLKKPTQFPAVSNGKVIGTLTAPVGAEVHLIKIQQGKIGVEFQGGGGWIPPGDTNLGELLR